MKRISNILMFLLIPLWVLAGVYSPSTLPRLNDFSRVSNPDGILSRATVDSINAKLLELDREKGVQCVVVVVEHLKGDDPHQFSLDLGKQWGVGSSSNTGLVIVLATEDRSYAVTTGRGMEEHLTDAQLHFLRRDVFEPLLREGEWDEAVFVLVKKIHGVLLLDEELTADDEISDEDAMLIVATMVLIVLFAMLVVYFASRQSRTCPKCGKVGLVKTGNLVRINSRRYKEEYKCPHCNHVLLRTRENDVFYGGTMGGVGGRSGGFGGGSGGGFSSFGGGSFGGGGISGRF